LVNIKINLYGPRKSAEILAVPCHYYMLREVAPQAHTFLLRVPVLLYKSHTQDFPQL